MRMRPLLGLCAAFAAGIALASFSSWVTWCLAVGCTTLIALSLFRGRTAVVWFTALALAGWLGAVRCAMVLRIPHDHVSRLPATSLTLTGSVSEDVEIEYDSRTDEAAVAKFILDVSSVHLDAVPQGSAGSTVSGRVVVRWKLPRSPHAALPLDHLPTPGDVVVLRGRLERPDGPRNPGAFDYRAYLARQGIFATLTVSQPEHARVIGRDGWANPFLSLAHSLRRGMLSACRRALPAPEGGLLAGILIGDRHQIPQTIQEEFERTGTTHILATAGLHVGMVVCLLTWLFRRCHVPRRPAVAAALVALALYAVMAGERAAVLRAVIVAAVYLTGELLEREPDFPNALALAAGALLLFNPLELFDPGFQLSFATVITIALLMPVFQRLHAKIGGSVRGESGWAQAFRSTGQGLASLALLAVAAQIGSGPLVAYYFYNASLVSVAANTLAVPAVFLVIALGFPMTLLWTIHPAFAAPLAFVLRGLLDYLVWIVRMFSAAPFASCNLSPPSPWLIAALYACIWSLAWCARSPMREGTRDDEIPKRRAARGLAFAMGGIVLCLMVWGFVSPRPRELRVTFLDVGQGDACVLESPGGKVVIVDTGGLIHDGEDDEGRMIVAPYLRYRGISHINAMVLTHPHADHIGGASSLLRRFPTEEVIDDGETEGSPLVPRLLGRAQAGGAQILTARIGQTLDFGDGVTAEVLGPSDTFAHKGANNASVVLRVRYGRTAFLLTGDAEAPEEMEILSRTQDLSCDVLKVGHHGSRTSSTQELVTAAHAKIAVISVGKRNLYGHPSQEVVERLQESGAQVYRTDRDGAIICHSNGGSVTVEKMLR